VQYELNVGQANYLLEVRETDPRRLQIEIQGQSIEVTVIDPGPPLVLSVDGRVFEVAPDGDQLRLGAHTARLIPKASAHGQGNSGAAAPNGPLTLRSPMPGRVVRVLCEVGQTVALGQPLLVLEAMKMENELVSPSTARVTELHVASGAAIEAGAPLLRLVPAPDASP
jgi:biotin carboxyl carrier protein